MLTTAENSAASGPAALHPDADLVMRAARGEASAFETIMRRYNRLLFRSARGVVADDAEAQDVVQEAYLRAFSMLATFRGECTLGTWLARIAIHAAIDTRRRLGRAVSIDATQGVDVEPASEHVMAFNAAATESPETHAERAQMRAILQRAIDSLPPIYRSVFVLRAVEEMSVEETADCLQISDDVVKTRYLRARAKLRDALGALLEAGMQEAYSFAGVRCDAVVAHVLAELRRQGRIRPSGSG